MSIIEFNDVHRAFTSGVDVIKGVTFSLAPGDVVGLLGKNGAGKTTLMRIAMGMLAVDRGAVRVFGADPREEPLAVKRRIGYVSEDQILPPFLTVSEVIDLHRSLFTDWDEASASDLLERFHLDPRARVRALSKGQARQVALLCAVAHRPELLLLDEPAGGLDPAARREFLETSIRLLNDAGSTILFSSHHMNDVERVARRVVLIHEGRLLVDDDLDRLREGSSIALLPYAGADGPAAAEPLRRRLLARPDCIAVRPRSDALHAVLLLDPARAEHMLASELDVQGARCRSAVLEDMFIEIVEGQS